MDACHEAQVIFCQAITVTNSSLRMENLIASLWRRGLGVVVTECQANHVDEKSPEQAQLENPGKGKASNSKGNGHNCDGRKLSK